MTTTLGEATVDAAAEMCSVFRPKENSRGRVSLEIANLARAPHLCSYITVRSCTRLTRLYLALDNGLPFPGTYTCLFVALATLDAPALIVRSRPRSDIIPTNRRRFRIIPPLHRPRGWHEKFLGALTLASCIHRPYYAPREQLQRRGRPLAHPQLLRPRGRGDAVARIASASHSRHIHQRSLCGTHCA